MENRFLEMDDYLGQLSGKKGRRCKTRSGNSLYKSGNGGNGYTSFQSSVWSQPFSAAERVLVILIENGGVDLGIPELVNKLFEVVPGADAIPDSYRAKLVTFIREKLKSFTDNLIESAELTLNRYTDAKPSLYGDVVVLRDGTASYQELKNKLIDISRSDKFADLFILTHGRKDHISVEGGIDSAKIAQMKTEYGKPLSIRSVYMMNCVGSSLNKAWLGAGAKVSSGSIENNYLPEPTMYFFWSNWKDGQSFENAATSAYRKTVNMMNDAVRGFVSGLPILGSSYLAGLIDFGSMDFVRVSAPTIEGQGSLNINSNSLTFTQSLSSGLATTVLPASLLRSLVLSQSDTQKQARAISQQGIDLIKSWEGFRPQLYNDPVGHCTVGYGTLLHTGNCDGRVSERPFVGGVSEASATQLLLKKAGDFQQIVNDNVTVALNQNQNDALVSFVYNVGGGNFRQSTLLRLLNQGNYAAVPTEMKKWTKARQNGNLVDLPGLVKRRAAEAELFQKQATGTAQSMSEPASIRDSIVALLDKWAGATEGVEQVEPGKPRFSEFRSDKYLDDQRKAAAKNGRTFTTCVEFMGWVLAKGVEAAQARLKVSPNLLNANLWYKEKRASLPQGAWTDYTPGTTERPQPGDIYVLTFADHVYKKGMPKTDANIKNYRGSFSHIGFVRSIKKNEAQEGEPVSETWEGVDGGAGTAGTYKYDKGTDTYTLQQKGAEKIETSMRTFYPETNIFPAGVKNQDQGPRHLLGWLNIDKIADKLE